MINKVSLGDFVKFLAARLQSKNVDIPFQNEKPWHILFYELKKSDDNPGKPEFLRSLRFDWDGPYPRSRELSDFLHALHWNSSVSAKNPHYDTISLSEDITELWKAESELLESQELTFLNNATDKAIRDFRDSF